MAGGSRPNTPSGYNNIALCHLASIFQKFINNFCIFENLLCPPVGLVFELEILVNAVAWIFHTYNTDFEFTRDPLEEFFTQADVLAVGVEVEHHL